MKRKSQKRKRRSSNVSRNEVENVGDVNFTGTDNRLEVNIAEQRLPSGERVKSEKGTNDTLNRQKHKKCSSEVSRSNIENAEDEECVGTDHGLKVKVGKQRSHSGDRVKSEKETEDTLNSRKRKRRSLKVSRKDVANVGDVKCMGPDSELTVNVAKPTLHSGERAKNEEEPKDTLNSKKRKRRSSKVSRSDIENVEDVECVSTDNGLKVKVGKQRSHSGESVKSEKETENTMNSRKRKKRRSSKVSREDVENVEDVKCVGTDNRYEEEEAEHRLPSGVKAKSEQEPEDTLNSKKRKRRSSKFSRSNVENVGDVNCMGTDNGLEVEVAKQRSHSGERVKREKEDDDSLNSEKFTHDGWWCEECAIEFEYAYKYWRHIGEQHGQWKHTCLECGRGFLGKTELRKHQFTHDRESSVVCEVCGKGLRDKGQLKTHMLSHTKEKAYACSLCDKRYSFQRDRDDHFLSVHKGIRRHKCNICEKLFTSSASLCVHRKGHFREHTKKSPPKTPELRYQCPYCDRSFVKKRKFFKHRQSHIDQLLKCRICTAQFPTTVALFTHVLNSHKDSIAVTERADTDNPQVGTDDSESHPSAVKKLSIVKSEISPEDDTTSKDNGDADDYADDGDDDEDNAISESNDNEMDRGAGMDENRHDHSPEEGGSESGDRRSSVTGENEAVPEMMVFCQMCETKFPSALARSRHLIAAHGLTSLPCDECEERFTTPVALERHLAWHKRQWGVKHGAEKRDMRKNGPLTCSVCDRTFSGRGSYTKHLRSHFVMHCGLKNEPSSGELEQSEDLDSPHQDLDSLGDDQLMGNHVKKDINKDHTSTMKIEEGDFSSGQNLGEAVIEKKASVIVSTTELNSGTVVDENARVKMEGASVRESRKGFGEIPSCNNEVSALKVKSKRDIDAFRTAQDEVTDEWREDRRPSSGAQLQASSASSPRQCHTSTGADLFSTSQESDTVPDHDSSQEEKVFAPVPSSLSSIRQSPVCEMSAGMTDGENGQEEEEEKENAITCELCDDLFPSVLARSRHYLSQHGFSSLPCPICDESFRTPIGFERHRLRHEFITKNDSVTGNVIGGSPAPTKLNPHDLNCALCSKTFSAALVLFRHYLSEHHFSSLQCLICDNVYHTPIAMEKHKLTCNCDESSNSGSVHSVQPLSQYAKGASHIVDASKAANLDLATHPTHPFTCKICSVTCVSADDLSQHRLSEHGPMLSEVGLKFETPISQRQCSADRTVHTHVFNGASEGANGDANLRTGSIVPDSPSSSWRLSEIDECMAPCKEKATDHMDTSTIVNITCKFCNESFQSSLARSHHYMDYHRMRSVPCDDCGKSFPTPVALERHFVKEGCLISQNSSLPAASQMSSPLTETPVAPSPDSEAVTRNVFECTICGQEFTCSLVLSRHYMVDHHLKSLNCGYCDESFSTPVAFERHQVSVHSSKDDSSVCSDVAVCDRGFTCDRCHKHFTTVVAWSKHMAVVHKLDLFECGICDGQFTSPVVLQRHLLSHQLTQ